MPHLALDPVLAGSAIVMALQVALSSLSLHEAVSRSMRDASRSIDLAPCLSLSCLCSCMCPE